MNQISTVDELYRHWGFREKPFQKYEAESEGEELTKFFLEPAWLGAVTDMKASHSVALFGPRGMGKTAIRLCVEQSAAERDNGPIPVPYVNFEHITGAESESDRQLKHLNQMIRLMLAFGVLHRHKVAASVGALHPPKPLLAEMLHRYFRSPDDLAEVIELNKDFVVSGSEKAAESYSQILTQAYPWYTFRPVRRFTRTHWKRSIQFTLEVFKRGVNPELLSAAERERRRDFLRLAAVAEEFHGNSWWILIDRLDEHFERVGRTGSVGSVEVKSLAVMLATSLMADTRLLLETEGVYFKFFLWSELREPLRQNDIRLDKVRNWGIEWSKEDLGLMIDRRLSYFSERRVTTLQDLCSKEDGDQIQRIVTRLAHGSPRRLLTLLDAIVPEHVAHCRRKGADVRTLAVESCVPGLAECCGRLAEDTYGDLSVEQFGMLGATFTVADVTKYLKLNSADSQLGEWEASGAIQRTGVGEGAETGFKVADPVLIWKIDRELILREK
jgi:hypothetical protein